MSLSSPKSENDDTVVVDTDEKGDVVTYELFYSPQTAKMHKENQVSDFDERIARIEKLVGTSAGQGLDNMPPTLAASSLISAITKLEQQITILSQPRHLEAVARRVKVLSSEMDRLNEVKSGRKDLSTSVGFGLSSGTSAYSAGLTGLSASPAANDTSNKENAPLSNEAENKVNQLFSTMEKIDPLIHLTPALLTRLKALQGLHTEAATFGRSIKIISTEQTRMAEELKSLETTCETVSHKSWELKPL
ncbi:uncharacterized protein BYT42DRAFT_496199 [Radiomyces spectabilis]|uniref:uncharacterized protein n=1 Tax=Radiomyces spectabilis TaxID=64574 RepID=UPI00221E8986|nr:uncharacterized protein BYT42DRAFT_496199 [Radiomyces spectabilis]KAI8379725.1 hypothetical protein BYT42DRAFT_496199 [Radiomyces spectabilis]